jgi:tripartite-type tricarboxylate transporter receptor subunit TctC
VQTQERFGVYARADTPAATVLALNRLVREAIDTADFRAMCEKFTSEASGSSPAEFDALIRQDNERWRGIVKTTGYTPEQ